MQNKQGNRFRIWSVRIALLLLGMLVLAALAIWLFLRGSLARLDGTITSPGLTAGATVARDAHGVPTITGASRLDVAYASGYVQAQDRFFQMDLLRRVAAGELAELFGPRALALDKSHRLHRFRARAELALQAMTAQERAFVARYVAGVNDGLNGLSARPFEYVLVQAAPRPWTAADSLLVVWAMYFDLQGGQEARELARGWIKDHSNAEQLAFMLPSSSRWDAPLDAEAIAAQPAPIPATAPSWWGAAGAGSPPLKLVSADTLDFVGSNNWAVAGSRSSNGAAIVSNDMHLSIQLPNTWYRAVLQFPDAAGKPLRVAGVMLPGAPPVIVVGSNGHVAWGFTNSYGDYLDLIRMERRDTKPDQALSLGGWETLTAHDETILVKGGTSVVLPVRDSMFGPLREAAGTAYAVHWAAHAAGAVNLNALKMESVGTLDEALALAATLGVPAQNFVAGDDRGNIGWTIAGPLPRRAQEGASILSSFTLTPETEQAGWQGWLAPGDYPRVVNPAGGQLATANSRQLNGAGAALIGDGGFDLGARARQVQSGLTALGAKTDVAGVYSVALDDRALFMAAWRDRAIAALDRPGRDNSLPRTEFLRLLKTTWTGHASVDSVAYRLTRGFMFAVYSELYGSLDATLVKLDDRAAMSAASARWPAVIARLLDEKPAAWLPDRFPTWQALELMAIDRVIADLTKDGQPLAAATWGKRNTAAIAHPIAASLPPLLRRWLAVPADMLAGDSNMPRVAGRNFGASERLTVSPGKEEQGVFNMPGGQSGHPLSPYFLAGHEDWVKGTPTPLLPGPAQHTLTFVK